MKLAAVTPYTFSDPAQFRPAGPNPLASDAYTHDFIETRDFGHRDSKSRPPDQTDLVYFWSENTYVHWNRNLIALALQRRLNIGDTARLFAMVHTASADAIIAGFDSKYLVRHWRPVEAIRRAEEDSNPNTHRVPQWTPLLSVNHPEYPSAHTFWSGALTEMVASFFGTREVHWTIVTDRNAIPQVAQSERTYDNVDALMRDIEDARVRAGLHWRHSMRAGAQIGRHVAAHVRETFFRPTTATQAAELDRAS
jgi:hypothetical protein